MRPGRPPDGASVERAFYRAADPEDLDETCALDVAERGPVSLYELADLLGVTYQRAQQLEAQLLYRLKSRQSVRRVAEEVAG